MKFSFMELTDRRAAGLLIDISGERVIDDSWDVTIQVRVGPQHLPGWLKMKDLVGTAVTAVFGHIDAGDVLIAEKGS